MLQFVKEEHSSAMELDEKPMDEVEQVASQVRMAAEEHRRMEFSHERL